MLNRNFFRESIRFEANGAGGAGAVGSGSQTGAGDSAGGAAGTSGTGTGGTQGSNASQNTQIDYNRIQQMLEGTLRANEDTALKAYFKQQGLTPEQAQQAMNDFKAQQAANTPDMAALQSQVAQALDAQRQAEIQSAATMAAVALGIDAKTIPYVLKMADLSQVVGQDGKMNEETIKNALNKVLEDVPALKPQVVGNAGFRIGASGQQGQQSAAEDALKAAFGL